MIIPYDQEHFTIHINVRISGPFLGWVFSLGEGVKILSPENVVEQMKEEAKRLMKQYSI